MRGERCEPEGKLPSHVRASPRIAKLAQLASAAALSLACLHNLNTIKRACQIGASPHFNSQQPATKFQSRLPNPEAIMGDAGEHYNDGNRAFLQSLMARGSITYEDAQKVLAEIFTVQQGKPPSRLTMQRTSNTIIKESG
jgi:hypothetical protein